MGEWANTNVRMNKWQTRLDASNNNERRIDIPQVKQKQYNIEETTNIWQKSKDCNTYDPFCEDEPSVCALESAQQNSNMRKILNPSPSLDKSDIDFNVDVLYNCPGSPQQNFDPEEYFASVLQNIHRDWSLYDPAKADDYLKCQDFSYGLPDELLTDMGKENRKLRLLAAKQQRAGHYQPVRVDSMEDTLHKLKKPDKGLVGKSMTLSIPKSETTSAVGKMDGDKTPSGAFRPIKSDPVLGTQTNVPSKEIFKDSTGKTKTQKAGMQFRQKRIMSMPEVPSKGKLKKLQSQISSVFKKRESYPHDEAYTRYSRKRYVSSSSSSSSDTSPIIISYPSSPEALYDDEPFGKIDIDVDEIEKEASELEDAAPRWVPPVSILASHELVHQSSQEEYTTTDEWIVSKTGEYMYLIKEPCAESQLVVNTGLDSNVNAALSVETGKHSRSEHGLEGGVSESSAQLEDSLHRTSSPTRGIMNNEFQLNDGKIDVASRASSDPRAETEALGDAELYSQNNKDINHAFSAIESPELDYTTATETDNAPDIPKCQTSEAFDNDETDISAYSSCDEDIVTGKNTRDLPSSDAFKMDYENVIITAGLPVGPTLVPPPEPIPMLVDASPPTGDSPSPRGESPPRDGDQAGEDDTKPGGMDGELGEEEVEEDGEVNYSQHVAASLVNNTMAIMLLLDHKLASGSFQFSPSSEGCLIQDEGPEDCTPEGDLDAVQYQYQDPDENLEEDNLLMARTLHYMRRQHQELDRSKSFGNSVSKAFNEAVSKLEMGHDSRNKQFHKLFPCVPDSESVINTYSCALVKDILLQGRMFVSENWICFHSNIFTYEKQIAIKVETITKITKEKTAFVVPNAIGVQTPSEKHIFGSLLSRHSTHQLLYRVWKNAKGETESMSPGSSLQGDSDEDDIPDESEDDDDLDIEHDGPNGRVLPPVSVHDYQKMDSSRLSDSFVGSHTGQGSPRQPRLPSDQSHSMGDLPGQGHRSHVGYHHQLCQMLCSVSIFKSIMRVGSSLKQLPQYQPFLLLIGILLLCLTFSAAVLTIRIWRLQPHMSTPSQTSAHESVHLESMDNIGDLFLTEQSKHQEKVSHIQDTLSANLKALLQVQSSLRHLNKKSENVVSSTQPSEMIPDQGTKEDL